MLTSVSAGFMLLVYITNEWAGPLIALEAIPWMEFAIVDAAKSWRSAPDVFGDGFDAKRALFFIETPTRCTWFSTFLPTHRPFPKMPRGMVNWEQIE